MDSKPNPASLGAPTNQYDYDSEFEWLLCLCSAYQSKSCRLFSKRVSTFRAAGGKRVIAASSLHELEGGDLPPGVRVPIKSPIHTLRDASRRRAAR